MESGLNSPSDIGESGQALCLSIFYGKISGEILMKQKQFKNRRKTACCYGFLTMKHNLPGSQKSADYPFQTKKG